jgi:hypothetical protein
MKAFLSLLCVLLFNCSIGQAQSNLTPISYSRRIPNTVRKMMPKRMESKFFGSCRLENPKRVLFLCLYNAPRVDSKNYILDIFIQPAESKKIQRVNSLRQISKAGEFNTVDADILWIDPKTKKIPAIKLILSMRSKDKVLMFHGPEGSATLFSFGKGLQHKPTMQTFGWGGNNSESYSVSFGGVDERGYTAIVYSYRDSHAIGDKDTYWLWDGEKFSPEKDKPAEEETK